MTVTETLINPCCTWVSYAWKEGCINLIKLFDLSCCQEHNYCILMLVPLYMDEFLGKVASELFWFILCSHTGGSLVYRLIFSSYPVTQRSKLILIWLQLSWYAFLYVKKIEYARCIYIKPLVLCSLAESISYGLWVSLHDVQRRVGLRRFRHLFWPFPFLFFCEWTVMEEEEKDM